MSDEHIHVHPYRLTGSSAHRLEELLMDQNAGALKNGTFHLTNLKGSKAEIVAPEEFSGSNYDQTFLQGIDVKTYKQATSYITAKMRPNSDYNILRTDRLGEYTTKLHVTSSADKVQHRILVLDEPDYFDDNTSPASLGMSGVSGSRAQLDTSVNKAKARIYNKSYRERRDLGQADLFQDGTAYKDTTTVDPTEIVGVKLRGDGSIAGQAVEFPPYMVHATDRTSADGAIEIFPIRSVADRSTPEHPHTAQGIKADLNLIDLYRKSDVMTHQSQKLGTRKLVIGRTVRSFTSFICTQSTTVNNDTIVFGLGGISCTVTLRDAGVNISSINSSTKYIILDLGNATTGNWNSVGASGTPAVGQVFTASGTVGSTTGIVQEYAKYTGVKTGSSIAIEVVKGSSDNQFATRLSTAFNNVRSLGMRVSSTVTTNTVFLREVLDRKTTRGVSVSITDSSASTTKKITTATTIGAFVVEFSRYADYVYETVKTKALGGYDYYLDGVESFGIEVLDNAESVKLQVATSPMANSDDPSDLVDLDAYTPWLAQMRSGTFGESHIGPINTQGYVAPQHALSSPFEDNSDKDITGVRITDANTFAALPNFFLTDKRVTLTGRQYTGHNSLLFQTVWQNSVKSFVTSSHSAAYGSSLKTELGTEGKPTGDAGTATLSTKNNGNVAHGLTAGQRITLIDHLGDKIDYFVSNTADAGKAHLSSVNEGDVLEASPTGKIVTIKQLEVGKVYKIATVGTGNWKDVGADSTPAVGESFTANAARRTGTNATAYESTLASRSAGSTKGIAVGFDTGGATTQNGFLTLLKAAIEHANGHNGTILVSANPSDGASIQTRTLTQSGPGSGHGNSGIVENLATIESTSFSGGSISVKFEKTSPYFAESKHYAMKGSPALRDTTYPAVIAISGSHHLSGRAHDGSGDGGFKDDSPWTISYWMSGSDSRATHLTSTRDIIHFKNDPFDTADLYPNVENFKIRHYVSRNRGALYVTLYDNDFYPSNHHRVTFVFGAVRSGQTITGMRNSAQQASLYNTLKGGKSWNQIAVTYDGGMHSTVTHSSDEPYKGTNSGTTYRNFLQSLENETRPAADTITKGDTINISNANSLIDGTQYVITSLGSTTNDNWNTIRKEANVTSVVGTIFTADATSGTGTGTVKLKSTKYFETPDVSSTSTQILYDYGNDQYDPYTVERGNASSGRVECPVRLFLNGVDVTAGCLERITHTAVRTTGHNTRYGSDYLQAAIAASGTVTITNYANLSAGDTVVFQNAAGETITATAHGSTTTSSDTDNPTFAIGANNNATATNLATCLNANAALTAAASSAVVTITQVTAGPSGNKTITLTDAGDAGMSKTDIAGGLAAQDFRDIQYTGPDRSLAAAETARDSASTPFAGHTISKSKIVIGGLANATSRIAKTVKKTSTDNFATSTTTSQRTRVYAHQNSNYISEVAMWNTKLTDSNILAVWELSKFNDVLFTVAKPMAEAVTRMGASFEEGVDKDHVHETKGFVFASTEHGTDSLAFGGLKK